MKNITKLIGLLTILAAAHGAVFADFRLRQQITTNAGGDGFTQERAVWVKGPRERTENKFIDERMAAMMPLVAEVKQCDLRQTLKINDRSRKYLIEPFYVSNDGTQPAERPETKTETVRGGSLTWTFTLTDTGERREMFGLTARRLVIRQLVEASKDSCQGETKTSMEEDGWYVYLVPETANCSIELPRGEGGPTNPTCRDKVTLKGTIRYPGMMLEGTTKMTDLLRNDSMTSAVKTLELSKATLEAALFDIPAGYAEVNSEQSLLSGGGGGMFGAGGGGRNNQPTAGKKPVAVDFFSGSTGKIDQPALRQMVAQRVSSGGVNAVLAMSQADIAAGVYRNVVGVEIRSVKESGASKLGGLFGKVTGADEAAKLGKSEAEVVVTLYAGDGKTVIATATAKEKADGKADAAVRAALDRALPQILARLEK